MAPRLALLVLLTTVGAACAGSLKQFGIQEPLGNGESYVWQVRAWHAHQLWVPVNDPLDIVLLRDRCMPAGHGLHGCYSREDSSITASWRIRDPSIAEVVPTARTGWRFGSSSANARVRGLRPGKTLLIVTLPNGAFYDTITVLPAFDSLHIEPRDSVHHAGDTVWFRVQGLDRTGKQVAVLPWPYSHGRQVGASKRGAVPIVFDDVQPLAVPASPVEVTIGTKTHSMTFRVAARRQQCSRHPPREAVRFDPSRVFELQGTFRFRLARLVGGKDEAGVGGIVTLQTHDSVRSDRFIKGMIGRAPGVRPLWGWIDSLWGAPGWELRTASRDPDDPGIEMVGGSLVFGWPNAFDGVTTSMAVTHLSPKGFWGRWDSGGGFEMMVDSSGREVRERPGVRYFCAERL